MEVTRHPITESTLQNFQERFPAFYDSHFLSIIYDFDAGNAARKYMHRVSIKVSTPDWGSQTHLPLPERIVVLFELEGVIDYMLFRKSDHIFNHLQEIGVFVNEGIVTLDFMPLSISQTTSNEDFRKIQEDRLASSKAGIFTVSCKTCYWSILSTEN